MKMPTLTEYLAGGIKISGYAFAKWIEATPEDRFSWNPVAEGSHCGRSISDQASECVFVNYRLIAQLTDAEAPKEHPVFKTKEDAVIAMRESSFQLSKAILNASDTKLMEEIEMGQMRIPIVQAIAIGHFNMSYHGGAINYIQTLYGDKEFIFPSLE